MLLNPLNEYSFLILTAADLLVLGLLLARKGLNPRIAAAWLAASLALGAGWLSLRTGAGTYEQADQAELVIRSAERPVLVELYSDYCVACLAARPGLDALERDLAGRLDVVRLNVASPAGRQLGAELGLRVTPTFILFNASGRELWRSPGSLDDVRVRSLLESS